MNEPESGSTKAAWRSRLRAARRAVTHEQHVAEAEDLALGVGTLVAGQVPGTVCGYLPVGTEPGSAAMLDGLLALGWRVLLPIVEEDGPLEWAVYYGVDGLHPGPFGLREPGGRRLGAAAVAEASIVLVPALAVDRRGVRLGRGAGHYDRSLTLADPTARRIALVRDDELVDELPSEPHDIRMHAVLTPGYGLCEFA